MKASNADLSLSCAPQKVVLVIFLFFFFSPGGCVGY